MLDNVELFSQSSLKFSKDKIVYFDPFKINEEYHDADYIFITHDHFDHFDVDSLKNIKKDDTKIVIPASLEDKTLDLFSEDNIFVVEPLKDYVVGDVSFRTVPAYNINKNFHPKSNNWVGYVINLDNHSYYVMGDTDSTPEAKAVKCDVLFVPIGGTYTMDYKEAAELTNIIRPLVAVPIHYSTVVGTKEDANKFLDLIEVDGMVIMK